MPTSGKSYYLAALAHELREILPEMFAINCVDADPVANALLRDYEASLFFNSRSDEQIPLGSLIGKTQPSGTLYDTVKYGDRLVHFAKPFTFLIEPAAHHNASADEHDCGRVLCLYDNAGEHFLAGEDTADKPGTRHLAESSILLLLIDLAQDPRLATLCHSDSVSMLAGNPLKRRQEDMIREVSSRIRRHREANRTGKTTGPSVFVLLTKSDLWLNGTALPDPCPYVEKLGHRGIDCNAIDRVSNDLRSTLLQHAPDIVRATEEISEFVRYLPVSALGVRPVTNGEGPAIRPCDIAPAWVTTPLIYGIGRCTKGLVYGTRSTASSAQ